MTTQCTKLTLLATVGTAIICLSGCGSVSPNDARRSQANEAIVLLASEYSGSWPRGLDPATNTTGRANLSQMNAIFGGLFQLMPKDNEFDIVGVLAKDYDIAQGGRELLIYLREGVRFSDGTPFDAEAVRFNIDRDLAEPCTCSPSGWPWDEGVPVSVSDENTVVLHFKIPYPAVINALPVSNINWIASPTALKEMGENEFSLRPVGAGPFTVVSNQLSSKLVLERNPRYWETDRPYLDRLIFQSIGSEQAGYQALLAGDADAFEGMMSTALIRDAQQRGEIVVTQQPATSPYLIQLNTTRPPFNDKRAREAIYYATDVEAIRKALFFDWYPTSQTFTGPGSLFHHDTVAGYRTYDLNRARALVSEIGGLTVNLATLKSFVPEQIIIALQTQWQEAGIDVSIATYEIAPLIRQLQSAKWEAMLQTAGSFDPEAGSGVRFRFRSDQQYTGVKDAALDQILDRAAASTDYQQRDQLYSEASEYISDHAYAPFLFAYAPAQISVRGIEGPGLTTRIPPIAINTGILWQYVDFVDN